MLFVLSSCSSEKQDNIKKEKQIKIVTERTFKNLGIGITDSIVIRQNVLNFKVEYVNNYYIMDKTNIFIFSYLIYNLDYLVTNFDTINFYYSFKNLVDGKFLKSDKNKTISVIQEFKTNPLCISLVPYLFKNSNTNEIIGINEMIKNLRNYLSEDEYPFRGDFWDFFYSYTLNCCDSSSEYHKIMKEIKHASEYPKHPMRPDIFEKIINEGKTYCTSARKYSDNE